MQMLIYFLTLQCTMQQRWCCTSPCDIRQCNLRSYRCASARTVRQFHLQTFFSLSLFQCWIVKVFFVWGLLFGFFFGVFVGFFRTVKTALQLCQSLCSFSFSPPLPLLIGLHTCNFWMKQAWTYSPNVVILLSSCSFCFCGLVLPIFSFSSLPVISQHTHMLIFYFRSAPL